MRVLARVLAHAKSTHLCPRLNFGETSTEAYALLSGLVVKWMFNQLGQRTMHLIATPRILFIADSAFAGKSGDNWPTKKKKGET